MRFWYCEAQFPGVGQGPYWIKDDEAGPYKVLAQGGLNASGWPVERNGNSLEEALINHGIVVFQLGRPATGPGEFYRRIWRKGAPGRRDFYDVEFHTAQGAALNLFTEMRNVFRYVDPAGNRDAFGHEIRQLLILGCTAVETQCKAVLREHGYARRDKAGDLVSEEWWRIDRDYFRVAQPLHLAQYEFRLRGHPLYPTVKPFEAWAGGSYERLPWYAAYNDTKHDGQDRFHHATLGHMVDAMAAVHALVAAQFGGFGNRYDYGYSEIDYFDLVRLPTFAADEIYVPKELGGEGAIWLPVNYPF